MNAPISPPLGAPRRVTRRIGLVCLLLALAAWSLSFLFRVPLRAALVGGCALIDGALLGLCLAAVTRTRRPVAIYAWLLGAALTFWPIWYDWPIWQGWPIGDPMTLHLWPGAPALAGSYYELLRAFLYLLGLPYPFARFGQHGPDPLQESRQETQETTDHTD